jgi:hypothetical protein
MTRLYLTLLLGYIVNVLIVLSGYNYLGTILACTVILYLYFFEFKKLENFTKDQSRNYSKKLTIALTILVILNQLTEFFILNLINF